MNRLDYQKALSRQQGLKFALSFNKKIINLCPLCGKEMKIYTRSCGRLGYKACICGYFERTKLTPK